VAPAKPGEKLGQIVRLGERKTQNGNAERETAWGKPPTRGRAPLKRGGLLKRGARGSHGGPWGPRVQDPKNWGFRKVTGGGPPKVGGYIFQNILTIHPPKDHGGGGKTRGGPGDGGTPGSETL